MQRRQRQKHLTKSEALIHILTQMGDDKLPDKVVDARPTTHEIFALAEEIGIEPEIPIKQKPKRSPTRLSARERWLTPEGEKTFPEKHLEHRQTPTGFRANSHPPKPGGQEYADIPLGKTTDRRCQENIEKGQRLLNRKGEPLEIFADGQRALQKEVVDKQVQEYLEKDLKPAECTLEEILCTLAQYGGRLEIKNFGTFIVLEVPGHLTRNSDLMPYRLVGGRRKIKFWPSENMLRLLNDDFYNNSEIEPRPNQDYFIERRNMIYE